MSTFKQIRANRRNAKKSTGPKTSAGKAKSRFNGLVHGLRSESGFIPGEDPQEFEQDLARLFAAWKPQDQIERSLLEQIASHQWKLARLDRAEAKFHSPGAMPPAQAVDAIHRLCLAQIRLVRAIYSTLAELEVGRRHAPPPRPAAAPSDPQP
jgi:hypothetical protein